MNFAELKALLRADLSRWEAPGTSSGRTSVLRMLSPRFLPVLFVRLARYFHEMRGGKVPAHLLTWLNVFIFGIEVTPRCVIGPGLMFPHTVGTVIGAAQIGSNATIFQGVTLGAVQINLDFDPALRPKLGNDVTVGSGAKVIGGILIGDGVGVGANSVVLHDVPAGARAVGVPARIL